MFSFFTYNETEYSVNHIKINDLNNYSQILYENFTHICLINVINVIISEEKEHIYMMINLMQWWLPFKWTVATAYSDFEKLNKHWYWPNIRWSRTEMLINKNI